VYLGAKKALYKYSSFPFLSLHKQYKTNWPSFIDNLETSGHFNKRRSLRRFLGPALFHQSQDAWMYALRLLLGKRRSVERSNGAFDFLHDHYISQRTICKCIRHTKRSSTNDVVIARNYPLLQLLAQL